MSHWTFLGSLEFGLALFGTLVLFHLIGYKFAWRYREPYIYADAFLKTKALADKGDALACYKMGGLYLKDARLTRYDRKMSRKYYRKARRRFSDLAEFYDPFACFMLAEIYRMKLSFGLRLTLYRLVFFWRRDAMWDVNYYRARVLYLEKTEHQSLDAFKNLGILFEEGWGGARDEKKALENYKKAADQGDFQSQHKAAHFLKEDKKPDEALHYYLLAAKNSQGSAGPAKAIQTNIQFYIGGAYEHGVGRPVSFEDAYFWYSIAASRGLEDAEKRRKCLDASLTVKAKLAIQERLKEFHRHLQN